MTTSSEETQDAILGGAITVVQPRHGYRFSIDSILLARFATARPRDRVLELGAGCGVIAMTIAATVHPREIVAVEIQAEMAALVERNARLNGFRNLRSIAADVRSPNIAGIARASFDLVVANPPFHARSAGRESPNLSRRQARGGSGASMSEFIRAARRYVRNGGRVAMVFAASRSAEAIAEMRAARLEPKRIRLVHPRLDRSASSIMIEARAGGGSEVIAEPPLIIEQRPGVYSEETRVMLESL